MANLREKITSNNKKWKILTEKRMNTFVTKIIDNLILSTYEDHRP